MSEREKERERERIDYGQRRLGANRQSQSLFGFPIFSSLPLGNSPILQGAGIERASYRRIRSRRLARPTYMHTVLGLLYSEVTFGKVCVGNSCLVWMLGSRRAVDSAKILRVHAATHKVGCNRDKSQQDSVFDGSAPSHLVVVQNHLQLSPVMGSPGLDAGCPVPIVHQRRLPEWDLMLKFFRYSKSRSTSWHPSAAGRPADQISLAVGNSPRADTTTPALCRAPPP